MSILPCARLILASLTLSLSSGNKPDPSSEGVEVASAEGDTEVWPRPRARSGTSRQGWHTTPRFLYDDPLQPRPARVWIDLPPEWMPSSRVGEQGRLALLLDHRAHFELSRGRTLSIGTVSGALQSSYEHPQGRFAARVTLLPRAWVVQLEFDPLGSLR